VERRRKDEQEGGIEVMKREEEGVYSGWREVFSRRRKELLGPGTREAELLVEALDGFVLFELEEDDSREDFFIPIDYALEFRSHGDLSPAPG